MQVLGSNSVTVMCRQGRDIDSHYIQNAHINDSLFQAHEGVLDDLEAYEV